MKPQYYLILLVLTVFSIPHNTYAQTFEQDIIGTWTFDFDTSFTKMGTSSKSLLDAMESPQQQIIENLYKNRTITFNIDGSYIQTLADGRTSIATWAINGTSLILTSASGDKNIQKINALTHATMKLQRKVEGQGKALFNEWYFTKN